MTIGQRTIQRCALCGEKLLDNKNAAAPIGPNGEPPDFPVWGERALVTVTEGNPTEYILAGDFVAVEKLPEDFCLALVEE